MARADRLFLTFRLGDGLYAIGAEEVMEVVRMPALARLPWAPRGLAGVANLRGAVVPVASLAGLLDRASGAVGPDSRVIVLRGEAPMAIAVDRVEALLTAPPGSLENGAAALAARPGDQAVGSFRLAGGTGGVEDTVTVLDVRALLAAAFTAAKPRGMGRFGTGPRPLAAQAPAATPAAAREKLLTFMAAGQEFGLPLAQVREVLPAPAGLATVPGGEALVLGIAGYRDGLLPLFSLRGLLGLQIAPPDGRDRIVVTVMGNETAGAGGVKVGLVVDRISDLVFAEPDLIEPTPPVLAARAGGEAQITSIYRGDGGRRLVSILSPDRLFREDAMRRLGEVAGSRAEAPIEDGDAMATERRFLVFRLAEEEFALPIEVVDEVARVPERLTQVPKAPAFLDGIMNLRGQVLPVVDQRRRFGMPPMAGPGKRRLVVVRTERHRAGLIVDSVSEVLTRRDDAIAPSPDLAGEAQPLVTGVINLEQAGRMILVLDPAELLSRSERDLLDDFQAAADSP